MSVTESAKRKVQTHVMGLYITSRCTLNCKLCASGIPYYTDAHHMDTSKVAETFRRLFHLYDSVNHADVLGGEPLMHPQIDLIITELFKYREFVPEFRIITNGTIVPSDKLCESIRAILEAGTKFLVLLDYYGSYSVKFSDVRDKLNRYEIPVRVDNYSGDKNEQYSGGWVKYGDYIPNNRSAEEIERQWQECICRDLNYHEVWEGKVYPCAYSYAFSALGEAKKEYVMRKDEYVDLFDDSTDEQRRDILRGFNLQPNSACAYCNSLSKTSVRYPAAEQLARN